MIFYNNLKFLSLFSIDSLENYLQELINLSFEYSSNYIFSYSVLDFRKFPFKFLYNIKNKDNIFNKFLFLLKIYLEKDIFFSSLYLFLNLNIKSTFNQLFQMIGYRGYSDLKKFNIYLSSNLYSGLSLKDFIFSLYTARKSIIDGSINTSDSGYISRRLVEVLREITIKEVNCNTKYLFFYNDNSIYRNINISFLCFSNKITCLNCLNINYKLYNINSYNKGVVSSQALGEPSTQMLLRTFHLGGNINKSNYYASIENKSMLDDKEGINVNSIFKFNYKKNIIYKYIIYNKIYNCIRFNYNLNKYNINFINNFKFYNYNYNFIYPIIFKIDNNIWSLNFLYNYFNNFNFNNSRLYKNNIINRNLIYLKV